MKDIINKSGAKVAISATPINVVSAFSELERSFSDSTTFRQAVGILEKNGVSLILTSERGSVQIIIPESAYVALA